MLIILQVLARKIIHFTGVVTESDSKNEIRAIEKLCMTQHTHKNIVSVFDYGRLSHSVCFIDMELGDMNLDQWIYKTWDDSTAKRLPFLATELCPQVRMGQIWKIMEDITRAVDFIHSSHDIHRDIKPSNGFYSFWKICFNSH